MLMEKSQSVAAYSGIIFCFMDEVEKRIKKKKYKITLDGSRS